jgi:formylmethanofuran dehydrogenase subunit A
MAALTDLTWQQLASKLPTGAITVSTDNKVVIDVSAVNDGTIDGLTDTGVVKFFSLLFTAANKAQTDANVDQVDGERLSAFSPATIGTNANGLITLTRPFVCRAELATATNIIGTNT